MRGSLQGLAYFEALKRLQIPALLLLGFDSFEETPLPLENYLPRNIESLTIADDLTAVDEYGCGWTDYSLLLVLRSWLRCWRSVTPRLQCISLMLYEADAECNPPLRAELRQLCGEVGVAVQIDKRLPDLWSGDMPEG